MSRERLEAGGDRYAVARESVEDSGNAWVAHMRGLQADNELTAENVENRIRAIERIGGHGRMPNYWREALFVAFAADDIAAARRAADTGIPCPVYGEARGTSSCEKCGGAIVNCPVYGPGERRRAMDAERLSPGSSRA